MCPRLGICQESERGYQGSWAASIIAMLLVVPSGAWDRWLELAGGQASVYSGLRTE